MEWAQGGGLVDRNFLTIELIGAGEGNIDSQSNIDYEFPDQSFNCLPLQLNKRNGKKLLKRQEEKGEIEIRYLDESGFCLIPYIPYAWQETNQKIEIKSQQSKRLNV
jgi:hypothetical protein